MRLIARQLAEAIGPTDSRPLKLRSFPYGRIEVDQSQRYYRFMYALARDMRPAVYVELGVLHGWGIAHVQAASPGTLITGVDLTFKNLAIPRIGLTLIQADSIVAAGLFSAGEADMILFDSDHSSKHMLAEFDAWDPLCRVGCVQLFDDIAAPESLDAWSAIPGPKHEVHELHPEQGFGVRIKPS